MSLTSSLPRPQLSQVQLPGAVVTRCSWGDISAYSFRAYENNPNLWAGIHVLTPSEVAQRQAQAYAAIQQAYPETAQGVQRNGLVYLVPTGTPLVPPTPTDTHPAYYSFGGTDKQVLSSFQWQLKTLLG